jgi:acetyl esterase/lipase
MKRLPSIQLAVRRLVLALSALAWALATPPARADGPLDNHPDNVRRIPKLGIEVPAERREELEAKLLKLNTAIQPLAKSKDPRTVELLPDVEIFYEAVRTALEFQEFFDLKETAAAVELLDEGLVRAEQLTRGEAPWTTETGLVVRGYRSKIDRSVQPYGLVIPAHYVPGPHRWRVDLWFHGRGETLSEVNFLAQRRKQVGTFAPEDAIVVHPYGRYSNANKFAGETDVFEALESVKKRYRVDDDRISVRGFSMGGASTWHLAVHHPTLWAAANPGAGFSETPEFLRVFQKEDLKPTWYERKLWHLYDCTDWAGNLYHCPTVAYSGEIDRQKQAADIMAEALREEGIELTHVIGPKTAHAYEPKARDEVERRVSGLVKMGKDAFFDSVGFTTYTLKYDRCGTIRVDGLEEHWERASVLLVDNIDSLSLSTVNVSALTIEYPSGTTSFDPAEPVVVDLDGHEIEAGRAGTDRSFKAQFYKDADGWKLGADPTAGLKKVHGLQGPIDDAFMDSFIFVRPTGKARNEAVEAWSKAELVRAVEHWRRHFRGRARVIDDTEIDEADIAGSNLILWGDDQSNAVWKRIADQLPIRYEGDSLVVDPAGAYERRFEAEHHAPIMIYPNPLNPKRYVVTNSSFTFREFAYLNNARQVPMLPDWAIVDLREKPGAVRPGKIAAADFFGEKWEVLPPHEGQSRTANVVR